MQAEVDRSFVKIPIKLETKNLDTRASVQVAGRDKMELEWSNHIGMRLMYYADKRGGAQNGSNRPESCMWIFSNDQSLEEKRHDTTSYMPEQIAFFG